MSDYNEHLISMAGGDGDPDVLADVLAAHSVAGMSGGTHIACRCNRTWVTQAEYREHLRIMLTDAGIGVLP